MSTKVFVESWAKKSGAKKYLKKLFFQVFFAVTVLSTVLVYVSREKIKKGALYELYCHFKEKYP